MSNPPPLVSPCGHVPACPPPACLPPAVRAATPVASPAPAPAGAQGNAAPGGPPQPALMVAAGYITTFAGTMDMSATTVEELRNRTPRFEGANLAPMAGVPIVGLFFVQRFNNVSDEWANCARILRDVLRTDSGKLNRAATNYVAAEQASTMKPN